MLCAESLIRCYWCGGWGYQSIFPASINGRIESRFCTNCANENIPEHIKGKYGTPILLEETGIERHWREQRLRQISEGEGK